MNLKTLIAQLTSHEGIRLEPYRCPAGYLTIGVGRNLETVGISEWEARIMLYDDIARAADACRDLFPNFETLSDTRQHVLIDMCFNLGKAGLAQFIKMREAVLAGQWKRAASEMKNSKWADQVKSRAVTLANMMIKGR